MVFKKVKIRNSAATLTAVIMCLLIGLAIFFGSYLYVADSIISANLTMDTKYSEAYTNLSAAQTDLEINVNDIKTNLDAIKESESTMEAAWNGLKGLGNTLKLPINFIDVVLTGWQSIGPTLDVLPGWAFALIFIGIVAFIVFLVLKILKGEPAM